MNMERGLHYGVVHLHANEVPAAAPMFLNNFLRANGVSDPALLINLGSVYINDRRVEREVVEVRSGDYVRVHSQPRRYKKPEHLKSRILEQSSDYILFDKPAGIPVHSQVDNSRENLISFLETELNQELFVTHRLDIATSGCLLIAKSEQARREINRLFRDRLIKKHYVAVTEKAVAPQTYVHYMKPSFKSPKELSSEPHAEWPRCELKVLACKKVAEFFEVEIELLTGRPQQIRAQLSTLSAPIVGDKKYGSTIILPQPNSILLRCSKLEFDKEMLALSSRISVSGGLGVLDEGD